MGCSRVKGRGAMLERQGATEAGEGAAAAHADLVWAGHRQCPCEEGTRRSCVIRGSAGAHLLLPGGWGLRGQWQGLSPLLAAKSGRLALASWGPKPRSEAGRGALPAGGLGWKGVLAHLPAPRGAIPPSPGIRQNAASSAAQDRALKRRRKQFKGLEVHPTGVLTRPEELQKIRPASLARLQHLPHKYGSAMQDPIGQG